ncbi:MAG: hypothetical protein AB4080_13295 [Trichodesmium sp.]
MEPQTINLPEPLASALLSYMRDRQDSPTPNIVIQTAVEEFLTQRGYFSPPKKHLQITPASKGSGYKKTSINHDSVIANFPTQEQP